MTVGQIVGLVVSILGSLVAAAVAAYMFVLRYAMSQREKAVELQNQAVVARLVIVETDNRATANKMHQLELDARGTLHDVQGLKSDVADIKQNMVRKTEWEEHRTHVNTSLGAIAGKLDDLVRS